MVLVLVMVLVTVDFPVECPMDNPPDCLYHYLTKTGGLLMEEKIVIQGVCNRIKGALVENGHGMLTNQRFIYSKHSLAKIAAMGVLVNLTQGSYEFDIPVTNIASVTEKKRLLSKTLLISTHSGEEYQFAFTKLIEWQIAFSNLLSAKN